MYQVGVSEDIQDFIKPYPAPVKASSSKNSYSKYGIKKKSSPKPEYNYDEEIKLHLTNLYGKEKADSMLENKMVDAVEKDKLDSNRVSSNFDSLPIDESALQVPTLTPKRSVLRRNSGQNRNTGLRRGKSTRKMSPEKYERIQNARKSKRRRQEMYRIKKSSRKVENMNRNYALRKGSKQSLNNPYSGMYDDFSLSTYDNIDESSARYTENPSEKLEHSDGVQMSRNLHKSPRNSRGKRYLNSSRLLRSPRGLRSSTYHKSVNSGSPRSRKRNKLLRKKKARGRGSPRMKKRGLRVRPKPKHPAKLKNRKWSKYGDFEHNGSQKKYRRQDRVKSQKPRKRKNPWSDYEGSHSSRGEDIESQYEMTEFINSIN
jgi:hypothetical protein